MGKDRVEYDYYYGMQSQQFYFIQIPQELFENDSFRDMSIASKVLYGLLLKRMHLSRKNHWYDLPDESGRRKVYIEYSIESIQKELNVSKPTAVSLMAELEQIGLIEKKRRPNLATKIYVKNFLEVLNDIEEKEQIKEIIANETEEKIQGESLKKPEVKEVNFRKSENFTSAKNKEKSGSQKSLLPTSGSQKTLLPEVKNFNPKDSNNNLNIYNNNLSINQSNNINIQEDRWRDREGILKKIQLNVDYGALVMAHWREQKRIDEMLQLMTDCICSSAQNQKINGETIPTDVVRKKFMKIRSEHIEYVITAMDASAVKIKNIRMYLITALYNAVLTIDNYYQAEVNYDNHNPDYLLPGK